MHMYLNPKIDVHSEDLDEDEDEDDDVEGPAELFPHDRHSMSAMRDRMIDQMYAAYCRSPWYRK